MFPNQAHHYSSIDYQCCKWLHKVQTHPTMWRVWNPNSNGLSGPGQSELSLWPPRYFIVFTKPHYPYASHSSDTSLCLQSHITHTPGVLQIIHCVYKATLPICQAFFSGQFAEVKGRLYVLQLQGQGQGWLTWNVWLSVKRKAFVIIKQIFTFVIIKQIFTFVIIKQIFTYYHTAQCTTSDKDTTHTWASLTHPTHTWSSIQHSSDYLTHTWSSIQHSSDYLTHTWSSIQHSSDYLTHTWSSIQHSSDYLTHTWSPNKHLTIKHTPDNPPYTYLTIPNTWVTN